MNVFQSGDICDCTKNKLRAEEAKETNLCLFKQKMETLNVIYVSSVDFADCKVSKAEILRGMIADKLTTAAQEILAVVERTVAGYEEEASGFRQEIDRQRRQLEVLLQPQVKLCRIGR